MRTGYLAATFLAALYGACTAPASAPPTATPAPRAATSVVENREAVSLLGEPLIRPRLSDEARRKLEADLERARRDQALDPAAEEGFIWVGRRLGYLGRYREAIEVFTEGLGAHPGSFRLLRHRGHRQITLRKLDEAVLDLTRAADLAAGMPDEIEPDGMPNDRNVPRSTTQSNIWYHLGLAHYLRGEFDRAEPAWRRCLEFSRVNDDMLVATSYWLVATLWRRGLVEDARMVLDPIHPGMEIFENFAYHRLLLAYRAESPPDGLIDPEPEDATEFATLAYGVGNWHLAGRRTERAREIFERIVRAGGWPAFGHIAAEADLARMTPRR